MDRNLGKRYSTHNTIIPNVKVCEIFIDDKGVKWIGSAAGLLSFSDSLWSLYDDTNSPLGRWAVYSIVPDNEDNFWVGFKFDGVAKFDGESYTYFSYENSNLPSNTVYSVAVDSSNNLWVATNGSGIAKYDGSEWTTFDKSNSELPDDYTFWIVVDEFDNKWIGTLKGGLSIFNENGVRLTQILH